MNYEPVIGLEVHIQLLTDSKIFCGCGTQFGAEQNTQVCPVCLGMPGVLPVLNKKVVEFAIKMALATNCKINRRSVFARKNYFYPDLPKGYQISQFEEPFSEHGYITIQSKDSTEKKIGLTRIHFEEDAGKSMHSEHYVSSDETLIDVNRCGVPLLEIVSEPDIRTPNEAYTYLVKLRQIVRYLGVCDGNMEEGSLRCDANVSVRPVGETKLGVKTELKNMNSFKSVEKALEYEINRQISVLKDGEKINQQTLLWDADRNVAEPMRSKEDSHDYRYFPDPDLVPVVVEHDWIDNVKNEMPEPAGYKIKRFVEEYGLPDYDARVLTEDIGVADYFETVAGRVSDKKIASNWIMGEVLRVVKSSTGHVKDLRVTPEFLADIINMIDEGVLSNTIAKSVFEKCQQTGDNPRDIVKKEGMQQMSDTGEIEALIENVIQGSPNEVSAFKAGKTKIIGFFVGQVMKATQGKANPKKVNEILMKKLNEH